MKSGVVFAVTYNYTGYPLVRQARHMVASGQLGEIRKVIVEYNQGLAIDAARRHWQQAGRLAHRPGEERHRRLCRRYRFARRESGGDDHRTGDRVLVRRSDDLFVPGRKLDDDGNIPMRYTNGARAAC